MEAGKKVQKEQKKTTKMSMNVLCCCCCCFVMCGFLFQKISEENCGCPTPCHFALYEPSVSYAAVSNHLVNKLLTSKEANHLVRKLEVASEATAKMDNDTFEAFCRLPMVYTNNMQTSRS